MSDKKIPPEPSAKDSHFFQWLEQLFYTPDGVCTPEKIDVRVVKGSDGERLGPMIKQLTFAPSPTTRVMMQATEEEKHKTANGEKGKKSPSASIPTKEMLVALANEIIFLCQRDCDQQRKTTRYGVHAIHFSRTPEIYTRWLMRLNPQGVHSKEEGGREVEGEADDEEGGLPARDRFPKQVLDHHERMFNLYGGGMEGLIDRYDRVRERDMVEIQQLRDENRNLREERVRLLDHEAERSMALEWNKVKVQSAGRAIEMGMDLAPTFLNQLVGKKVLPESASAESVVLKNFFKREKDGGKLTDAQVEAAFGVYDDQPPHNVIKLGVLSAEQGQLLFLVSQGKIPSDELDKLLPGGELEVTTEQVLKLQQIFPMDQIGPVMALVGARLQKKTSPK